MPPIKISQGPTFKGFISTLGLILLVIGICVTIFGAFINFSIVTLTIGLVLLYLGLILFLSIRGVQIDTTTKDVKPYFDFLFAKIGSWESLNDYEELILRYAKESQTMNSRYSSTTFNTRTFEIFLASSYKPELLLKEFQDYEEAKAFLIEYSEKLGKTKIDRYETMKEQLQQRRKSIRR